jgi:hypothetical protein
VLGLVVLAFVVVACEEKLSAPTMAHITGRLTLAGKPLSPGQNVMFFNTTNGDLAFGVTDEQGRFDINSWKNGEMTPGQYHVYLRPPAQEVPTDGPSRFNDDWQVPADPEFPTRYLDHHTSGLEFKIAAGENDVAIEITAEDVRPVESPGAPATADVAPKTGS